MEFQFRLLIFWTIQFSYAMPISAALSSFIDITEEKQVEWMFYYENSNSLDYATKFYTSGVAYKKTLSFSNELDSYNYGEESKHVEFVRFCANSTSFFNTLKQLSKFEGKLDRSKFWKPSFFVGWPGSLKVNSSSEVEIFFRDQIMPSYSKNLTIETNLYVVIPIRHRNDNLTSLTLWEAYTVNNQSIYHELLPLDWYKQTNKMGRRENLQGALVRVMTTDDPNYEIIAKFKNKTGSPEFESGTAVSLLKFMKDRLNFTISAVKGNWTLEDSEGVVIGGVLEMQADIADLCISQTPMTPRREEHIHFLQPTYLDGLRAFFIQPAASHYRDIYLKSFSQNVWISLLGIWILMLFAMHGFAWIKNRYSDPEVLDNEILDESILWALGAICQQGFHKVPASLSIRMVFFIGYLTGLVCFVAFSASIVSTLSIKSDPMREFEDLVKANFQMYVQEYSTAIVFLKDFLKTQKDSSHIVNQSVAFSYLLDAKRSFITYPDDFNLVTESKFTSKFLCKTFSSLPVNKAPVQSAMMVQKGSPFTEFFNYQIILMMERGINHRFFVEFIRGTRQTCLDFSAGYTQSLQMIDVQTAFVILAIGYFASAALLGIEKTYKQSEIRVLLT